jgi:hypothetical protein
MGLKKENKDKKIYTLSGVELELELGILIRYK